MSLPVSIVLLTRDGAATLPAVLDGIAAQETGFPVEVVAVDSGSSDGTLEILKPRVDRLIRIRPEEFNHGLTRNLGIRHAHGDLVVLLVQDAVPASARWLAELTRPLRADPRLAGSYARQVVRPDASAITRHHLGNWVATAATPRTTFVRAEQFLRLPPGERFLSCVFDDVCSCVRRSAWERFPFPATPIAEDLEWARDVLLAGYGLAYVPEAAVLHSHERSARYEFKRTLLVHQRLRALFGFRMVPSPVHLVGAVALTLATHVRLLLRGPAGPRSWPAEVGRGLALAVLWPLGQYLGALAADRGWRLGRVRGV
jgi:rhamnosyltransferase